MDNRMDDRIEEIRKKIGVCDDIIIKQLVDRMECIQEIIAYPAAGAGKKAGG